MMTQDWDIQARGDQCRQCETSFEGGQAYVSALSFGSEGYTRDDYCDGCWKQHETDATAFSVWRGIYKIPPPPPAEPLKKETAESLLRKLIEEGDGSKESVIYILAVMLERKKSLVEREVQQRADGVTLRVYEHRKSGETFVISDPQLTLDQLEPVQRDVVALMGDPAPPEVQTTDTTSAEGETTPDTPEAGEKLPAPPSGFKDGFYSKDDP